MLLTSGGPRGCLSAQYSWVSDISSSSEGLSGSALALKDGVYTGLPAQSGPRPQGGSTVYFSHKWDQPMYSQGPFQAWGALLLTQWLVTDSGGSPSSGPVLGGVPSGGWHLEVLSDLHAECSSGPPRLAPVPPGWPRAAAYPRLP